MALPAAVQRGDIATALGDALAGDLRHGRALVSVDTLGDLTAALTTACARFPERKAGSPWRRTAATGACRSRHRGRGSQT
jgi:hypothetical protein